MKIYMNQRENKQETWYIYRLSQTIWERFQLSDLYKCDHKSHLCTFYTLIKFHLIQTPT